MNEKKFYTVTELTRDIRSVLEGTFGDVWVEGEVSNFTMSSAGHAYFSLKDENSVINCVLFKGNNFRIKFSIEDGLKVLCSGKISVYDKRGQYQLYVNDVEPRGHGALQLAFERLKEKLNKEGLFDEKHKKTLPFLPVCIGVVTSTKGAAISDILKVVKRRFSNAEILISPVRVQGDEAKFDISEAIKELNEFNKYVSEHPEKNQNNLDVIIVGRGGGSLEDLWPFNEEIVVRAIFESEIPVISAVGHEVDYTISDFVSDLRAPTPSAAAELVVPIKRDIKELIIKNAGRLYLSIKNKVDSLQDKVTGLRESYILREPVNVLLQMSQRIDDLRESADTSFSHLMELKKSEFAAIVGKLETLSPLNVLQRGYSITAKDGKVVKTTKVLQKGDYLETKFSKGIAKSIVESVKV